MTAPAPPTARLPRWTRCHSVARPSWQEYWHMGETAMRLARVTSRSGRGVNRFTPSLYLGLLLGADGAVTLEVALQTLAAAGLGLEVAQPAVGDAVVPAARVPVDHALGAGRVPV